MKITVFTPTYNRAHTLRRLYDSLVRQDYADFEWLIIDDGSSDDTRDVIASFEEERKIDIRCYCVENGGKHRAINKGTDLASGEIFFIVDSDDFLAPHALTTLQYWFDSIVGLNCFAGVAGLCGYSEDTMIGKSFLGQYVDVLYFDRGKYRIGGDKAEAFYTEVLKRYKFPEFEGETFITEAVVWVKLADDGFKLRYFNEIIYIGEYMQDGLSAKSTKLRKKNILGALYAYKYLYSNNNFNYILRIRYLINYYRFYLYNRIFNYL